MKFIVERSKYLLAILVLLLGWWWLALLVDNSALPEPYLAMSSFIHGLQGGLLLHLRVSFFRVLISLSLAVFLGVPSGLILGRTPGLDQYLAPVLYLTYPIPKVVFMPLLFIFLGIGDLSEVVLIALIVYYQVLVTTRDAARNLEREYILSVQSLGAGTWELYRHVYFPGCLPEILTSLRLGLGTAMAVLFLTETYATQQGIGYFIMDSLARMSYEDMFAGIIAMALMGLVLYLFLDWGEKKICLWKSLDK
ncbi:MAG TPA: ABC transporter permease [Clostridia bacterium]|nr:ABC transporter permease [Clostridia bacterium]